MFYSLQKVSHRVSMKFIKLKNGSLGKKEFTREPERDKEAYKKRPPIKLSKEQLRKLNESFEIKSYLKYWQV